ncbi:hypothetical protein [Sandaracinus amylolyticus]|uniref:hypothetical protein n=1 Tax=Sandaracinus amylolyticus TaxID=927083 RepID=UPI001F2E0852|nr:hypothetical protein [Sandaracinus amylolyticus]UJR85331.1 Hypothetical protein I5071_74110 [Sandaracinus amylolyticus]
MTAARIPFTPADESAIRTLVGTMLFLLVVNFVFGALGLLGGCLSFAGVPAQAQFHPMAAVGAAITALTILLYGAGMIGQGALLVQVRRALEQVVTTDTQDQALLATAFARLRLFFLLEAVLFFVMMGMQCGGFLTQAFGPATPMMPGAMGGGM